MSGPGTYFSDRDRLPQRTANEARKRRASNRHIVQGGQNTLPIGFEFGQTGVISGTPIDQTPATQVNTRQPIITLKDYEENTLAYFGRASIPNYGIGGFIELRQSNTNDNSEYFAVDIQGGNMPYNVARLINNGATNVSPGCQWIRVAMTGNSTITLQDTKVSIENLTNKLDPGQVKEGWWIGFLDYLGTAGANTTLSINPDSTNTGWTLNGSTNTQVIMNSARQSVRLFWASNTHIMIQNY